MLKRVAALDLGTNTFHLLIADVLSNEIRQVIQAEQQHVKLGEGGINKGEISEIAFKRGVDALSYFQQLIQKSEVALVCAVGTAALRTARNGGDFVQEVKKQTGICIDIIDGNQEAALIYKGVRQAIEIEETSLIMDIGGGSVEFIIANKNDILWKASYPIGAAKLMDSFHQSDPISEDDIKKIYDYLQDTLEHLAAAVRRFKPGCLIGSAGAFETLAALCQIKFDGTRRPIEKSYLFNKSELEVVISDIIQSTHRDRENNKAIISVRTDMIVVASLLVEYIIEQFNIQSIYMSTYALKEGLLIEAANRPSCG